MKKRILSASLAAVIGLSSVVPAFAAVTPADGLLNATGEYANSTGSIVADKDAVDINGVVGKDTTQGKYSQYDTVVDGYPGTTMDETKSEVNVYATVAPSYSIKIPKTIILSASGLGLYDIGVKGDMTGAQVLTIRPDDKIADTTETDFYMSEQNAFVGKKDDIVAVVEQSKTEWVWSDINKSDYTWLAEAGKITAEDISAGSWAGTFDFVISMNIEEPVSSTTNYTKEEVDTNERLIPIGKTDPYNVIVEFNEDYTEVAITKNGENSDGLMMSWVDEESGDLTGVSPLLEKASTLEVINVENGVVNIGGGMMANMDGFASVYSNIDPNIDANTPEGELYFKENYNFSALSANPLMDFGDFALTTLNINGNTVTEIGMFSFIGCNNLKNINLNDDITLICDAAFMICNLETLGKLPENLEHIGSCAFMYSGIKYLEFGSKISVIDGQAFQVCSLIENDVVLPESIVDMGQFNIGSGNVFNACGIDTFYGIAGSYAETWANENGYTFVAI